MQSPTGPPILGVDTLQDVREMMETTQFNGCMSAANQAMIACEEIGYTAFKVDLWIKGIGDGIGHQITIAYNEPNEWHLFSNNQYGLILSNDWREPVMEYFNGRYRRIELWKPVSHNQGSIN